MSQRKIPVILTESRWKAIIYILGVMGGYTGYADDIEKQIAKSKRNK